jgi:hypothetical protein
MMRVIANRQITGEYGTVLPGQAFDVRDELADDLMKRNLVRTAAAPRVQYDIRAFQPAEAPEVSAREPFRHLPVPNEESTDLAAEGDSLLPGTDVSKAEPTDSFGRAGRARSAAGRR